MDYTLEVIPLPVSDLDRAKEFYETKCGFHVDIDQEVVPGVRLVQLTPPGSGCSVVLGDTVWESTPGPTPEPGSYQGLQLCVSDLKQAREELTARGLELSEPVSYADADGATFMYFTDPDGNGWSIQEYKVRAARPLREVI
ncbi:VOC family protein [Streptomyces spectabilis]|uniref:Catechol 2,3-dioxygenase-like lactoylglutathione lyase family enzyme n=1 Tax=Streptomyces spectabilis TaxID=68270 RepID=A0A5P2X8S3_STRST|nr:VOC family protein [Streptomyces spectabilis]MBB5102959.1 catechol 2,3-dioxygenase-like lactoylglutathione lyase family enzyme [Streptomyces spectabilis]MCI3902159.1 VOC family protein [Streptomyces spectabilis]QEV59545.1 VOC family protein [Streptomyces spectabilis]GGV15638.1 glyoxalase [Streptomyces spectabilis]